MKIEVLTRIVELLYEKNNSFYYKIEYDVEKKLLSLYSNRFADATTPFQFVNSDLLTSVEKKRKFLCLLVEMIGKPKSFINIKNQDIYLSEKYHFKNDPENLLEVFEKMRKIFWKLADFRNVIKGFEMKYESKEGRTLDTKLSALNSDSDTSIKKESLFIFKEEWSSDSNKDRQMPTVISDSVLDFIIEELLEYLENT